MYHSGKDYYYLGIVSMYGVFKKWTSCSLGALAPSKLSRPPSSSSLLLLASPPSSLPPLLYLPSPIDCGPGGAGSRQYILCDLFAAWCCGLSAQASPQRSPAGQGVGPRAVASTSTNLGPHRHYLGSEFPPSRRFARTVSIIRHTPLGYTLSTIDDLAPAQPHTFC